LKLLFLIVLFWMEQHLFCFYVQNNDFLLLFIFSAVCRKIFDVASARPPRIGGSIQSSFLIHCRVEGQKQNLKPTENTIISRTVVLLLMISLVNMPALSLEP